MSADEPIAICVQLWTKPGQEARLIAYEDAVLALIPKHGGQVVQRVRSEEPGEAAFEVHVITLPSEAALQSYLEDPARLALTDQRESAIDRTTITRVLIVE